MNRQSLLRSLERFKNGENIISIHQDYEDDFQKYLEINNITHYYKEKKKCYIYHKTVALPMALLRNSEMRKIRQITRETKLQKLKDTRDEIDKEIDKLS